MENHITMERVKKWLNNRENQLQMIKMLDSMPSASKQMKSLARAEAFRKEGNLLFILSDTDENFQKVYKFYAKSIAYAPANSREIALAYGNLSAVLFRLKKHSECLQAIDCCFNSDYPDESKFKLYLRKIECLKIINEPFKAKEVYEQTLTWIGTKPEQAELKQKLEICYTKQVNIQLPFTNEEIDRIWKQFSIKSFNEEIPGASDAIGLKYSESQGRHYVAERDIKPGEILMKDHPYAVVCVDRSRYQSCWDCCKSLTNCIPCDFCDQVIFCSEKCKNQAWQEYHQMECMYLHFMFNQPSAEKDAFYDKMNVAVRLLLLASKEYGSIQEVRKAFNETTLESADPRTRGFSNGKLLVDKFAGCINLKANSNLSSDDFLIVVTTILCHIEATFSLLDKTNKQNWMNLAENEDFVFATFIIARYIDILFTNRMDLDKNFPWIGCTEMTCLSIPASFFNHSCVANTFIVQTKDYVKIVAQKPIKKGEQIFLNYVGEDVVSKEERQKYLQLRYKLECNCDACANDWPIQTQYPRIQDLSPEYFYMIPCFDETANTLYPVIDNMDTKHGNIIRWNNMKNILKKLGETIETMDANLPQPCNATDGTQGLLHLFCMKLHGAFL